MLLSRTQALLCSREGALAAAAVKYDSSSSIVGQHGRVEGRQRVEECAGNALRSELGGLADIHEHNEVCVQKRETSLARGFQRSIATGSWLAPLTRAPTHGRRGRFTEKSIHQYGQGFGFGRY